jgi:hypothetical protein
MKYALPLLAILPLACAPTASAAPDTPARPATPGHDTADKPADACKPTGKVVFEIDHRVEPGAKLATSATKLYPTGAWTRDATDADGKPEPQATGCVASADYKQLADALRAAPWKVTTARVHCMAMASNFTEFQLDGKKVFTQKLCSGHTLDDKSRAALERAVAQLEPPAAPPAAPPSPPAKP